MAIRLAILGSERSVEIRSELGGRSLIISQEAPDADAEHEHEQSGYEDMIHFDLWLGPKRVHKRNLSEVDKGGGGVVG